MEWKNASDELPEYGETVWISNGKGWTTLGCLFFEDGFLWAETNGIIYEQDGKIVTECEIDDLDVRYWHPVPTPINNEQ